MQPSRRAEQVDAGWLEAHPLPDLDDGDKFERGTVAVIAGGPRTPGAALLAGRAALRIGAGRMRIATARSVAVALGVAVPEAMVVGLPEDHDGGLVPEESALELLLDGVRTVLIGPGAESSTIDRVVETVVAFAASDCVVVLDARAIGAIATPAAQSLRGRLVLTPNRQEVAQAIGHERGDGPAELAARAGAVVTCFGQISCPDGRTLLVDGHGSGLGTSGSGDVLAGLVAGAVSRCSADPCLAAVWGTVAHTDAGRRLLASRHHGAYLAGELIDAVGTAPL